MRTILPSVYFSIYLLASIGVTGLIKADVVVLKNGKSLEGHVEQKEDHVILKLDFGAIKIKRSEIAEIRTQTTAMDEFTQRSKALQAEQPETSEGKQTLAEQWYRLAEWCHAQGLKRGREDALLRAIEADPDHEAARQALGYTRINGVWLTGAERNRALGLVLHNGQWITPEARDEALAAQEANIRKEQDEKQRLLDLQIKQAQLDKLEAEKKLAELQSDRDRQERAAAWAALEQERRRLQEERFRQAYPPILIVNPRPIPGKPPIKEEPNCPKKTDKELDKDAGKKTEKPNAEREPSPEVTKAPAPVTPKPPASEQPKYQVSRRDAQ